MFVSPPGSTYYARPRLGLAEPITPSHVELLALRCQQVGVPTSIEWVAELTPSLETSAVAAGLSVEHHSLLTLDVADFRPADIDPPFVRRVASPSDAHFLHAARAAAEVSFAAGGTTRGAEGAAERDSAEAGLGEALKARLTSQALNGAAITVVAIDPAAGVVASGVLQPVGSHAEIVAVATLPAFRRLGLAAAVSSALVSEAHSNGIEYLLLSAQSDPVARIYETIGFRRVGTHLAAEPAA